jgi:hypothetical protein
MSSSFLTPTLQPGLSADNRLTVMDMHCTGNGRSVACVSANVTTGTVWLTLRRADAQGMAADPLTISTTVLTWQPNPFFAGALRPAGVAAYNQTLGLSTASVIIAGGGAANDTHYALQVLVYVTTCDDMDSDVPCDTVRVVASVGPAAPTGGFSLNVAPTSVRPATNTTYDISYSCYQGTSAPDVFTTLGGSAVVQYHRNEPYDNSIIAQIMAQQSIENLTQYVPDMWTNRTFGVAIIGTETGTGSPLAIVPSPQNGPERASHALASVGASSTGFDLRLVLHSNQTADAGTFLSQLSAAVATPDIPYATHCAWWSAFWARSAVTVAIADNASLAASINEK